MRILARPNMVTVLLEYNNLIQSEWKHKTKVLEGNPALYHTVLLYSIVRIAMCIFLESVPIMSAFYSVLSHFSLTKINTFLYPSLYVPVAHGAK